MIRDVGLELGSEEGSIGGGGGGGHKPQQRVGRCGRVAETDPASMLRRQGTRVVTTNQVTVP